MTEECRLTDNWEFRRLQDGATESAWSVVDLPHTPFVSGLNGEDHWFGLCEYRRTLSIAVRPGWRAVLQLGASMHTTAVLVDGRLLASHTGGYLPFEVDLTTALSDGAAHQLVLRLDNRDTPDIPPGKAFGELDYCWFGGLYRDASLLLRPPVHITDSVGASQPAGGGVFVRTLSADATQARQLVRVHVRNVSSKPALIQIRASLELAGASVATALSSPVTLAPSTGQHVELELLVSNPRLWSPASPTLHSLMVTVLRQDGEQLDARSIKTGLRRINFSRSRGFEINGQRLRLRGTNRHQEFPRVGYAAGETAERRDARRLKEAGFDYVRLSHYPQSPAFLDACDELGIVVMNAIPGWQFIGGEAFREACYQNARELVRRDRNHACVVLWELSLNETQMDADFMARLHAIGHEEYPGDQMFTCGWMDAYDVYIHSRQHGGIHTWKNGDKALVVAEYGDWEFYASNHGFDQTTGAGVHDLRTNARQLRADGERGLRQQAANHTIALNDTLSSPAVLDGQWSLFDYSRGYHPLRAACGVMDIHRLPKFSYHFYRSQRHPSEGGQGWTGGPTVFIASHWTPASNLSVQVFSNCEEVCLFLDGKEVGRQRPSVSWMTQFLPHPPFVFDLPCFTPGTLRAVAFLGGREVAVHEVSTPGQTAGLTLSIDDLERHAQAGSADVLVAHASLRDARGNLCINATDTVHFSLAGTARLLGPDSVHAEAGIASVTLRLAPDFKGLTLRASVQGLPEASLTRPASQSLFT